MSATQGCDQSLYFWLQLHHSPRLGPTTVLPLIEKFGSAQSLIENHDNQYKRLTTALANTDLKAVEADIAWCEKKPHRHIICYDDAQYPPLLRNISDPPLVLYVIGDPSLLHLPQLAIVGSRNPTAGGIDTATAFAKSLSQSGLMITSGLALGIDGAAHQGALLANSPTIAVTGNGLDKIYPTRHKTLAKQICEQGALVSEFSPGTPPLAANFPRRNRIISGLSLGVLVIEAALRSGSLITARLASEQGREVFAIPGSIHNPLSRGCHRLLKDGACLIESCDGILAEIGSLLGTFEIKTTAEASSIASTDPVSSSVAPELWPYIDHDPIGIDALIERSGLTAERVSAMLLILELEGRITTAPGGRFCRT